MNNLFLTVLVLIVYRTIGYGLFSDPRSSDFEGETLDTKFLIQFTVYLVIVTVLFYYVITKYRKLGLKLLYSSVFIVVIVLFVSEVFYALDEVQKTMDIILIVSISSLITIFLSITFYVYLKGLPLLKIRNYGLLMVCVLTSRVISLSLDLQSFITIAIIIAIYDIWNVFRGPLTKLFGPPSKTNSRTNSMKPYISDEMVLAICEQGTPVIINQDKGIMTGIGDFFFYSSLIFTGFLYWGIFGLILSFICINIGILLTHMALEFLSPLPGLPIPVILTLLGYFLLNSLF